jgi:hypothetical protein
MIHRIRVQNFKSIIDVTVDLSPVTVLVGKSGTGKSNFVHALRFLRDVLLSEPQQMQILQQTWPLLRPAALSNEPTRFQVEFSISGVDERFNYVLSLHATGLQLPVLEERLDLGEKCLFHQHAVSAGRKSGTAPQNVHVHYQTKWTVSPELLQVPPPGAIALGRIPSISEIVIAFTALTSGIGCYVFSDKILSGSIQNQTAPGLAQSAPGLDDEATNFLEALKDILTNRQELKVRKIMVGAVQRVNPTVSAVEPNHIVVGHKVNGKTLALFLSQESDGFRRFYAHLLALYQRPPRQTLSFEHPEDGIHPGALSLLAEEFKAAPDDGRGQVILTTHSPKLLDHFDAEQIRVVELVGFETRIGFVSNEQKEAMHDKLLDAGELLTVDPARIVII